MIFHINTLAQKKDKAGAISNLFTIQNADYEELHWTPNKSKLLSLSSTKSDSSRCWYKHKK